MTNLPDDIDQLKAMLLQLHAEIGSLRAVLHAQTEEVVELKNRLQLLIEQLNLSQSKRFSAKSEQVPKGTFNEAEQQNTLHKPAPEHHKKGRKPLPNALDREVVTHTLNAPHCECCGHELHQCGTETSEELKIIPQKVSVIRHERAKYACRHCEHTETRSKIVTAPKLPSMIAKSIGCQETFAAVVTAKYVDALPLYRQEEILKRCDIELSRTTLANWYVQLDSKVGVIIDEMKRHLMTESIICADETTVQVLDEPNRKTQSQSYMWVYRSGEFEAAPVVIYDYQPSRAGLCVQNFLGDYAGYLLTDGYAGYDTLNHVTQAGCWAHARRYFVEAQKSQPKKKVGRVEKALNYLGKLYGVEREAKAFSPDERKLLRQKKSVPILDEFYQWLVETQPSVLPKSALGRAVNYMLNQWPKLKTYLEDGRLSIDNNVTERDIRPFTTGRKNWMFSQSVGGAIASANLYSLVMTCRANDLNPYHYFVHLFRELPKRTSNDDLSNLLPWNVATSEAK